MDSIRIDFVGEREGGLTMIDSMSPRKSALSKIPGMGRSVQRLGGSNHKFLGRCPRCLTIQNVGADGCMRSHLNKGNRPCTGNGKRAVLHSVRGIHYNDNYQEEA